MELTNSNSGLDKGTLEKEWANAEARLKLGKDDRAAWNKLTYTVRPYVYFDKILIVWTFEKDQPQVKDIFTVTSLDASFQDGLWVRAKSKVTGYEALLTHTPRRLAPGLDVFAWLPFFNELRFQSADWNNPAAPRNLRLAVCFKMQEHPQATRLHEGVRYLSELHTFREQFPQFRDTRF